MVKQTFMNKTATAPIVLPFGPKPGWELEEGDEFDRKDKRNISERWETWSSRALRQFRGGKTDSAPPPHTIQARGKCDLEIGPHVFPDTTFYEVHYLPSQPSSVVGLTYQSPTTGSCSSQPSTVPANVAKSLESENSSASLASNLTSVATITPALINQVNTAASSNPTLANLLQLAAAGLATPDQLKTLGLLIQSLATSEGTQPVLPPTVTPALPPLPTMTPASVTTPQIAPVKEFDLVLEFRENPNERWVFPRGLVTCERTTNLPAVNALSRTVMKVCLPFPKPVASEAVPVPGEAGPSISPTVEEPQVATLILERTPLAVWDTISRWAGNQEKLQQNKIKLDAMKPVEHVCLGYRLSEGPLLSQLQTVSAPTYTMKRLKMATTTATRAKRKIANKPKPVTQQIHQNLQDIGAVGAVEKPPPKRRRALHQFERPPMTPIQCVSCKNRDVPLILGGRFCRPCVEAGHTTTITQPFPPYRFSSYNQPSTTETTLFDTPK
ncbi:hypothetical protein C0995_004222 [Termitomyces sp. Mi166|nr:hypothetical protein C0995_004222 [Termitomyces sp. Mi166\